MRKKTLSEIMGEKNEEMVLTGYIGTRVAPALERDFKTHCKKLGISVADGLRMLIESELQQAAAPGAPSASPAITTQETAPAAPPIPKKEKEKASPSKEKEKAFTRNAYAEFIVQDETGKKLLPCPICGKFYPYSAFKARHTEKHGYLNTATFLNGHWDAVAVMIANYNANKKEAGL